MKGEKKNDNTITTWSIIAIFITCVAWGSIMYFSNLPWDVKGQFGDSFAVLNTLFSGLSIVLLISTLWLQRRQIDEQREELELNREEMKKQQEAQKEQLYLASLQTLIAAKYSSLDAKAKAIETTLPEWKKDGGFAFNKWRLETEKEVESYMAEIESIMKKHKINHEQ